MNSGTSPILMFRVDPSGGNVTMQVRLNGSEVLMWPFFNEPKPRSFDEVIRPTCCARPTTTHRDEVTGSGELHDLRHRHLLPGRRLNHVAGPGHLRRLTTARARLVRRRPRPPRRAAGRGRGEARALVAAGRHWTDSASWQQRTPAADESPSGHRIAGCVRNALNPTVNHRTCRAVLAA